MPIFVCPVGDMGIQDEKSRGMARFLRWSRLESSFGKGAVPLLGSLSEEGRWGLDTARTLEEREREREMESGVAPQADTYDRTVLQVMAWRQLSRGYTVHLSIWKGSGGTVLRLTSWCFVTQC
uniref:Uncharacterized protein n=1 Tax=Odontella aurita TaxID=265563 RepID=A0A7S4JVH0_9STRA|mmetsp:Transcript_55196/g.165356  ORF Transcript_55196/g.165356 Transcript_55196/m.165356 type:complete len:123 (+) Transcript_55196:1121-1489(+)